MKKIKIFLPGLLCLLFICPLFHTASAQSAHPPFWNEIMGFAHQDSLHMPPKHAILFVGSSSFRKWTDVQQDFPGYRIINRGFGGSTLPDVIRYAGRIIFPYQPKQIVIYCGDNDAASSPSITADSIFNRFTRLYALIRSRLPRVKVTYVSIKPSPSREKFFPVMEKANWQIRTFLNTRKHASFVDIWHLMLDDHGQPRPELFGPDMLHMNARGYAIWQQAIRPQLLK
jgi:lysophospholipase L1-like esterase